jgi:hypothetical protein
VLTTIAEVQAKAGDVPAALQTVQTIQGEDDEFQKALALVRIGKVQAAHGDVAGASEIFQNAVRTAEFIKDPVQTVHDIQGNTETRVMSMAFFCGVKLAAIALAQSEAGGQAGSVATFAKAVSTARGMPDPRAGVVNYQAFSKDMLFSLIVKAQAKAGFVDDARKTASEIRVLPGLSRERGWGGGDPQVMAWYEIARAQGLRAEPHDAVAWIEALKGPTQKTYALLGLAEGLLERVGVEPPENKLFDI